VRWAFDGEQARRSVQVMGALRRDIGASSNGLRQPGGGARRQPGVKPLSANERAPHGLLSGDDQSGAVVVAA